MHLATKYFDLAKVKHMTSRIKEWEQKGEKNVFTGQESTINIADIEMFSRMPYQCYPMTVSKLSKGFGVCKEDHVIKEQHLKEKDTVPEV